MNEKSMKIGESIKSATIPTARIDAVGLSDAQWIHLVTFLGEAKSPLCIQGIDVFRVDRIECKNGHTEECEMSLRIDGLDDVKCAAVFAEAAAAALDKLGDSIRRITNGS